MKLETLESRLAPAFLGGLLGDTAPPVVRSVSLPIAQTYGTGKALNFTVNFNEPVRVVGDTTQVSIPLEVGYAMRQARYVSGSGTRSLNFRMVVTANDLDSNGISLGRVNANAIRDFDFASNQIVDRAGNPASNAIPASVNTSRIRIDATGPVVAGHGGLVTNGRQVSLSVKFDTPVSVIGRQKPFVPVVIGGERYNLNLVAGSGTSILTFAVTVPANKSMESPAFDYSKDMNQGTDSGEVCGEVIKLPAGTNLRDRLGNDTTPIGAKYGETYFDKNNNRVIVIGAHYELIKTVSKADLDKVLTEERDIFNPASNQAYWKDYVPPQYKQALNNVDLYRIAYRSTIPEQGNRPTVTYGLIAIPEGASNQSLPLLSVQHGTLFLKEWAPSLSFSWDKNSTAAVRNGHGLTQMQHYYASYEARLNVAQFAGQGYAVILPDYFGIGNSVENDSFVVKASEQRACMDMYDASLRLLQSNKLVASNLFLNGWSQGGLVSISFQEALEARGVAISGVSTAATPADTGMFATRFIFNPRPYSEVTVPDAAWSIFVHQFSSFALGGYSGQVNAPLELFGGNYEVSRKFYMREFRTMPEFKWQPDIRGVMEPVVVMDGVTYNTEVSKFLDQKIARDPRAYEQTAYAALIRDAGSGKTRLTSDMKMYYGDQDEGYTNAVCTIVDTRQRGTYGKTNIEQVKVDFASHRSTFLTAVAGQIEWFNSKLGLPDPANDLVATLINGGAAATLAWNTPAPNGLPINNYRVEWKRDSEEAWNSLNTGSVVPSFTITGLTPGQRYLHRVFAINSVPALQAGGTGLSSNVAVSGNQAPTAPAPQVSPPNPATGLVAGMVLATDPDHDPLTYTVSTPPAKGTVSMSPAGAFTYTPTAAARHAAAAPGATPADQADAFTVTVSDGYGGVVNVPIPVTIA
ncbi:MAG: fibronectin type III domain-containing protein [Planctomycetes bacterium]|nr:fibronectin type III domain-containing protein [Planctomycetota bacterium]